MTRHFSVPTFLRMTPNALLRAFFARLGHDMPDVPWSTIRERDIHPIVEAFQKLPVNDQAAAVAAMHNVFDLACENGWRALREAATISCNGLSALHVPHNGAPYCTAMWVWLHYPEVFDRAMLLFEVDGLGRWRKRKDLPRVSPSTTPETLSRLASMLAEFFQREEGRGQRCTVEHVRRSDGSDCYLAYPDDFVHTVISHDDDGSLTPRCIRSTFEVVFAYSQVEGTLELNAKVPARLKRDLEDIFCQVVIGQPVRPQSVDAAYNLNVLKDGPDRLETDPADRVTAMVRRLRLSIPESRQTITLEADHGGGSECIYRMLDEYINRERLPLADLDVASATIGLVLHATDCRRPSRVTFDVARPDTCTLRNHRPDRVALAQKYLKRWGITVG